MKTQNPAYKAKHVKGSNPFTESLKYIVQVDNQHIIVPQYETHDSSGLDFPTSDLSAEVYQLQSVLFNGSILINGGTVKIQDKDLSRWENIEKLFIFLRRFEYRDMQDFMHVFEDAITAFVEGNRAEDLSKNFRALHELQHLVRIIISLNNEPSKIANDLMRITHADRYGIENISE